MTQEEFAHAVGVTVSTVNRWENGHIEPSRLARKAIDNLVAAALGSPGTAPSTEAMPSPSPEPVAARALDTGAVEA